MERPILLWKVIENEQNLWHLKEEKACCTEKNLNLDEVILNFGESKCSVSKLVNWHMIFWIMFDVTWFREFCGWLSYLEYEQ